MADQSTPTLSIPKDVIEPIIQASIAAAVANALGDNASILRTAIDRVLTQKVDERGTPSSYSGRPFIDYLVSDSLRLAITAAVHEAMTLHREAVRAGVLRELAKKNSPFVKQLVDGMVSSVFDPKRFSYSLKIVVDGAS